MKKKTLWWCIEKTEQIFKIIPYKFDTSDPLMFFPPHSSARDRIFYHPVLTDLHSIALGAIFKLMSQQTMTLEWMKGLGEGLEEKVNSEITSIDIYNAIEKGREEKKFKGVVIRYLKGNLEIFPLPPSISLWVLLRWIPEGWISAGGIWMEKGVPAFVLKDFLQDIIDTKQRQTYETDNNSKI